MSQTTPLTQADLTAAKTGMRHILKDSRALWVQVKRGLPAGLHIDLSGADLSGWDLNGCDLSGVDLSGADLTNADLRGANLDHANLSGTHLLSAKLDGISAAGVDVTTLGSISIPGLARLLKAVQKP